MPPRQIWHEPPRPGESPSSSPQQQQTSPQQQQQQISLDSQIAKALQAQENHRARHPGRHSGGQHSGGHGSGRDPRDVRHGSGRDPRDEQLRIALEANPEGFVSVPMLYVACTLNEVPLKAFVDTGAQSAWPALQLDTAHTHSHSHLRPIPHPTHPTLPQ